MVTADGTGAWSQQFTALADGSYTLQILDQNNYLTEIIGGVVVDTDTTFNPPTTFATIDTPAQPYASATPVITGTGPASTAIDVTINGVTQVVVTNGSGVWSTTWASSLSDTSYSVQLVTADDYVSLQTDAFSIDTVAPLVPTVTAQTTNDTTPVISGTADPDEALQVTVDGVVYVLGSDPELSLQPDGSWSLDLSSLAPPLAGGVYDVTVVSTDDAGNTSSDVTSDEIIIDITDPDVPTITALQTNDPTPVLSGTADPDAELAITINGITYATDNSSTSGMPSPELSLLADGTWTLDLSAITPLADGSYEVVALSTDTAGNTASDVTTDELTIDTVPPSQPTVDSVLSNSDQPLLTGTAVGAIELTVEVDGIMYELGVDPALTLDGAGNWQLDLSATGQQLSDGTFDVAVTADDGLGNAISDLTTDEVVIDLTPPSPQR